MLQQPQQNKKWLIGGLVIALIVLLIALIFVFLPLLTNSPTTLAQSTVDYAATARVVLSQTAMPSATPTAKITQSAQPTSAPTQGPTAEPTLALSPERDLGNGMTVSGVPEEVSLEMSSSEYKSTLGYGSVHISAEPGVRTADAGDPNCDPERSCWHINPDIQHDLTDLQGEGIDLNEDAFTMCSFSRATFAFPDGTRIAFEATPMHSWLFVMAGLAPGEGDRNTQVIVTDYDAGFMTCTNLPPGARASENYVLQNFENMFDELCGAIDHCSSGSLALFSYEKKALTAFTQSAPDALLVHTTSNIK